MAVIFALAVLLWQPEHLEWQFRGLYIPRRIPLLLDIPDGSHVFSVVKAGLHYAI